MSGVLGTPIPLGKVMRSFAGNVLLLGLSALIAPDQGAAAQQFPAALSEAEVREVKAAIADMRKDARGPYLRIRWFCVDGSVQPPAGTPCRERGGGVQYAELNDRAKRLAELNVNVGTVLQSLSVAELFDADRDNYRLKELVLTNFLFEVDDGWVLRQARYYRGARQVEDEERKGHEFLEWLLSNREWTARNYFLATQLVATLPHMAVSDEQSARKIRNLATEIADLDAAFLPIRVKIHSFPSRDDLPAVERFLNARQHPPEVRERLQQLQSELRGQYDLRRNLLTLTRYRQRLPASYGDDLQALQRSYERGEPANAFSQIAALAPKLRRQILESSDGRLNLLLMDLVLTLQEQAFLLAQDLETQRSAPLPRSQRLRGLSEYFAIAHAVGFLSSRERAALDAEIARVLKGKSLAALEYRAALTYLSRSLDWSVATARSTFGPIVQRYLQFEPKASSFLDALARGSALLPLSMELGRLSADADRVLGASHEVLGREVSQGVRGLNPGVALGVLEIIEADAADFHVEPSKIYVIPETTPELTPPAGVLTLDAGNLLSHVQLLARNLGIPNASTASALLPTLRAHRGRPVFYAVSPLGRVSLKDPGELSDLERRLLDQGRAATRVKHKLDTSRLRLDRVEPIPLTELRAKDSGIVVGPKAANLGQLAAYFPGRVSAGVALPFGMFYRHVDRPFDSDRPVLRQLEAAYDSARAMRAAARDEAEIDRYMFNELARVRRAIVELEWQPEVKAAIERAVRASFGTDLSRGVFVRSDTNVEDLPQFSGAGLNLTVPHQRTLEAVLASIKRVWTSPFSERAYLWRRQVLEDQGQIYPSVLLLESVHSEKSGVLITSGLHLGSRHHLTIATAEGVGGAVEGEDAETLLVDREGRVKLLSQAKAPFRRALVDSGAGGAQMVATSRPEYLLTDPEIRQLIEVVRSWERRSSSSDRARVWDIEFGFAAGKLWLFQIRPFVRFRTSELLERLSALDREVLARAQTPVQLEEAI